MKYLISILFIASISCIVIGYISEAHYAQKVIGSGVVGLFVIVFPLFSYYRWKGKNINDYMITKENLDKMRNHEK